MLTQATLKPGQKGTLGLFKIYGDRLVCVRYRYDPRRGKRYKTVELIVDEAVWKPLRSPSELVWVWVAYEEHALRERVKGAGGAGMRSESCGGCRTGTWRRSSWRGG